MPQIEPLPQVPCKVSSPFVPVPATAPSQTLFEIWVRAIPLPSLGAAEEHPALLCNVGSLTQIRVRFIPQLSHFWPDPRHRSPDHFCIRGLRPAADPSPKAGNRPKVRQEEISHPQCKSGQIRRARFSKQLGPADLRPFTFPPLTVGLRMGEALGLRWSDVDLDPRTLRVNSQLQRIRESGGLVFSVPKTLLGGP
jgi:hypothetical protein